MPPIAVFAALTVGKDRSIVEAVGRKVMYLIRPVGVAGKCFRHNVLFSNL